MARKKKTMIYIILTVIAVAIITSAIITAAITYNLSKLQKMTSTEMLEYTTADCENALITVGKIQDGESSWVVYGKNGEILPQKAYTYEIGSLTKTFTAAALYKAYLDGKLGLDDSIDRYIDLPTGRGYPTIKRLITHTSGYSGWYFETPMTENFFKNRNDFYGVTDEMTAARLGKIKLENKDYPFLYSNFGFAAAGLVLENVYGTDYTDFINGFARNELGLKNTRITDNSGDAGDYMQWSTGGAYLPAGALVSDIDDMLEYARINTDGSREYLTKAHEALTDVTNDNPSYRKMGLITDAVGAAWMIDRENGFIWHNGGTDSQNCYLSMDIESGNAVVILSNQKPSYKIPATIIGPKLLKEMGEE